MIEPYVYVTTRGADALLYNTLDGATIHVMDARLIRLLRSLHDPGNGGVLLLKGTHLEQDESLIQFITELRDRFMGDIMDTALTTGRPTQPVPTLNLQADVKRQNNKAHIPVGKTVTYNLQEITFCFDSKTSLSISDYAGLLPQISKVRTIRLVDLPRYAHWKQLIPLLNNLSSEKRVVVDYRSDFEALDDMEALMDSPNSLEIKVSFPIDPSSWQNIRRFFTRSRVVANLNFRVTSSQEATQAERLAEELHVDNETFTPHFNGHNLAFFSENVFVNKEDILSEVQSMREIFAHQALNTRDFGKLTIGANGEVYANLHFPALGNIATHSIAELLVKEMTEGKSWLRIRDQAPCNGCVYQWLCPSPSDYELLIGKPNLCHERP